MSDSARSSLIPSATQLVGSTGEDVSNYAKGKENVSDADKAAPLDIDFKGKVKTYIGSNAPKHKGKFFEKLAQVEKDNSEMENIRREKMNEIYTKRMMGGK